MPTNLFDRSIGGLASLGVPAYWWLELGGISLEPEPYATIWPMFGAANQLLGMLALCALPRPCLIKMKTISQYLWVTVIPMIFVGVITLAGCYELFTLFVSGATSGESSQTLTMGINTILVGLVALLALIVLFDSARKWYGYLVRKHPLNSTEVFEGEGINIPAGPCC